MSDIHQRTFYLGSNLVVRTSLSKWSRTQVLVVDQHTLQSLKSVFLSRNFDQNMPKTASYTKLQKLPQRWEL